MKIMSEKRKQFDIDKTDIIMWNEKIYQLITQQESDSTFPVLKENQVREFINKDKLKKCDEYITNFTKVPITLYKLR